MTTLNENNRKPNFKKWICPLDGKITNSRGAPAHVRNKHHINWDKKYLIHPELLIKTSVDNSNIALQNTIDALLSDIEVRDHDLKDKINEELYRLLIRIRLNLRNNNTLRINRILEYINPITSSTILVKRKE